jgi:hypothetical protein
MKVRLKQFMIAYIVSNGTTYFESAAIAALTARIKNMFYYMTFLKLIGTAQGKSM